MKQPIYLFLLFICTFSFNLQAQTNQPVQTYRNPVIPGDFPDPSVIRVGNMYYAAGTTSDFAPNYPLYQSEDLVNWQRVGSVFNEKPDWTTGSFWAPELYYQNGTYYVFYTARRASDNISCIGVATTKDISKGFTDHGVLIAWGNEAIDAFVFKDTDGKYYITWKAYGLNPERPIEILGSELDLNKLKLTGEHFSLTRHDLGWKGNGDEGQCLVRHGAYYYLFYSMGGCCDNRCDYEVHVSRSKNLKSGWEQYPDAIMHGGGQWVCTGHGTLVETQDQRYFYMYHAYNANDFEFIGRQGMLDELLWNEQTGWPFFKYGPVPTIQAEVPFKNTIQKRDTLFEDDFSSTKNLKFWQWDLKGVKPEIKIQQGALQLTNDSTKIAFLGMPPKTGHYSLEAGVEGNSQNLKGLCIYGDQHNLLGFGLQGSQLVILKIQEGKQTMLTEKNVDASGTVYLKAEAINGRFFQFSWSADQKKWQTLAANEDWVDGTFLPRWGVAMRAGLMVGSKGGNTATFSYFTLHNEF